jgi:hypothetical protein
VDVVRNIFSQDYSNAKNVENLITIISLGNELGIIDVDEKRKIR